MRRKNLYHHIFVMLLVDTNLIHNSYQGKVKVNKLTIKFLPGNFSLDEYIAAIISGDT